MPANDKERLTLKMDGDWTTDDMVDLLASLTRLYALRYLSRELRYPEAFWGSCALTPIEPHMLEPDERLYIQRVSYGSPGLIELAGLAGAVVGLGQFILAILDRFRPTERKRRELANENAELENERIMIENAKALLQLPGSVATRTLVHQIAREGRTLERLAAKGLLVGASLQSRNSDSPRQENVDPPHRAPRLPKNARELFDEQVPHALRQHPENAREVDAIFCFRINGEGGGEWTCDLTADPPTCLPGAGDQAQCTIEVSHEDFMRMLTDPRAGVELYSEGKLKLSGDPMLATRLEAFFKLAADDDV